MNSSSSSQPATEPQPAEKETWTPPVLKKMDIEETAFGIGPQFDGDTKS
jgi:hypothetical protein